MGTAPLDSFNDTTDPFDPTCFHHLFEDQARLTPNRPALTCCGQVLTYVELNAQANQVARLIQRRHAGRGQCVALMMERSTAMIVGLLGIMKAGSAYVPLLPGAPPARVLNQLTETAAPIVLTDGTLEGSIPATYRGVVLCLDRNRPIFESELTTDLRRRSVPDDVAYVIYTSGSTGQPKGVAVRHDNLVNYARFLTHRIGLQTVSDGSALSFATVSTLAGISATPASFHASRLAAASMSSITRRVWMATRLRPTPR